MRDILGVSFVSIIIIAVAIAAVLSSIAAYFYFFIPSVSEVIHHPAPSHMPTEMDFMRNSLLPGHSLGILTGFGKINVTSVSIANPSSNQTFQNCSVIQQIFSPYFEKTGQVSSSPLNVTLKTLDSIPPHFLLDFDAPTVPRILHDSFYNSSEMAVDLNQNSNHPLHTITFSEYADRIASRSWFLLECSKPHESIAFPYVTIDGGANAIYYRGGETVHINGIVGFPNVIINASGPPPYSTFIFDKKIQTGAGGSFNYSFMLPSGVEKGTGWNILVQMPNGASDWFGLRIG
jgi:hypothetical protein